jgi:hypothetical protein
MPAMRAIDAFSLARRGSPGRLWPPDEYCSTLNSGCSESTLLKGALSKSNIDFENRAIAGRTTAGRTT